MTTSESTKPSLPAGRYVQVYLDSLRGGLDSKIKLLIPKLDKLKQLKIKGILWHVASYEDVTKFTPEVFKKLAKLCSERQMLALAAFGLRPTNPAVDGAHIGLIANLPECFAVVFDMEGAWEVKDGKIKAIELGTAFRKVAPDALALDQPWADPTYHWSAFPWEETAEFIDIRMPQFYVNNWMKQHGAKRYEICWTRFVNAWEKLKKRLEPKKLWKPVMYTIQGYKWVFKDLVNCLTSNPTLFIWSDPLPDDVCMAALQVVAALEAKNFHGPNAVRDFQASVGLVADNIYGPQTASKLGLPPPLPSE